MTQSNYDRSTQLMIKRLMKTLGKTEQQIISTSIRSLYLVNFSLTMEQALQYHDLITSAIDHDPHLEK